MAFSYTEHVGTVGGTTGPFSYGGPVDFLPADTESISTQLKVYKNGTLLTLTTDYTIDTVNEEITLVGQLFNTDLLRCARETKKDTRYIDFVDSTNITSELLDLDSNQLFFLVQEAIDLQNDAMTKGTDGNWNAEGRRIANVESAVNGTDAINLNQLLAATAGALPASLSGIGTLVYTGDGVQTLFPLPPAIAGIQNADDVEVYINGLRQRPGTHYTLVSGDVEITPAPTLSDTILMAYPEGTVSAQLTANSVTSVSIQNDAVTPSKIQEGSDGEVMATVAGAAAWTTLVASYISDFNTAVRTNRLDQMAPAGANYSMGSNKLTNLGTPTNAGDGATKAYVDLVSTALAAVLDKVAIVYGGSNGGKTASNGTSWTVTNFAAGNTTFTPAAGGTYMGIVISFNSSSGAHNSAFTQTFTNSSAPAAGGFGTSILFAIRKT